MYDNNNLIELNNKEIVDVSAGGETGDWLTCIGDFTLTGAAVGSGFPGFGTVAGTVTGAKVGLAVCSIARLMDRGN